VVGFLATNVLIFEATNIGFQDAILTLDGDEQVHRVVPVVRQRGEDGAEVLFKITESAPLMEFVADRGDSYNNQIIQNLCKHVGLGTQSGMSPRDRLSAFLDHMGRPEESKRAVLERFDSRQASRKKKKPKEDDHDDDAIEDEDDGVADEMDWLGAENSEDEDEEEKAEPAQKPEALTAVERSASASASHDDTRDRTPVTMPPLPALQKNDPPGCKSSLVFETASSSACWVGKLPKDAAYNFQASISRSFSSESLRQPSLTGAPNRHGAKATLTESQARQQVMHFLWSWYNLNDQEKMDHKVEYDNYLISRRGAGQQSLSVTKSSSSSSASASATSSRTSQSSSASSCSASTSSGSTSAPSVSSSSSSSSSSTCSAQPAKASSDKCASGNSLSKASRSEDAASDADPASAKRRRL
jgi:hypothetical protein